MSTIFESCFRTFFILLLSNCLNYELNSFYYVKQVWVFHWNTRTNDLYYRYFKMLKTLQFLTFKVTISIFSITINIQFLLLLLAVWSTSSEVFSLIGRFDTYRHNTDPTSVSYTHLDVYKRQVYGRQPRQKIGLDVKPVSGSATIVLPCDMLVTYSGNILATKLWQRRYGWKWMSTSRKDGNVWCIRRSVGMTALVFLLGTGTNHPCWNW